MRHDARVEVRHESWFDEQVAGCLREHGIAVCQSDAAEWPMRDAGCGESQPIDARARLRDNPASG